MRFSIPRKLSRLLISAGHILAIGVVSSVIAACAFKKTEPTPPTTADNVVDKLQKEKTREAADGILTKENVSISFVENPIPNSYQMVIRWPSSIRNITFRLNDGITQIKNNTDFAEFTVKDDDEQKVEMISYGTVSPAPLSSIVRNVRSPKDLVVGGTIRLSEDRVMTANRLFIQPMGQIITNGFQLTVNVNKLYLDQDDRAKRGDLAFVTLAKILTFVPGTVVASDRARKGSVIAINAREAHGDLRVAMIGANGRPGITGAEREPTLKDVPSRIPAPPLPEKRGTNGTQSPDVIGSRGTGRGGYDNSSLASEGVCTAEPGNGATGPEGKQGVQGGKGEQGGNCGMLLLNIEDSRDLRVEVRQKAGTPGKGGEGGPGFPGGLGGLPGNQPKRCSAANNGAQGSTGTKGDPGENGDPGESANIPRGSTPVSILELSP